MAEPVRGERAVPSQSAIDPHAEVDAVIAWLRERGYLNEERFVESRVQARAARFGVARIEQELSMHGVELDEEAAQVLRGSEFERAQALWQRRFGDEPARDARSAVRQARFLAGRGFGGDVIRRIVNDIPRGSTVAGRRAGRNGRGDDGGAE